MLIRAVQDKSWWYEDLSFGDEYIEQTYAYHVQADSS